MIFQDEIESAVLGKLLKIFEKIDVIEIEIISQMQFSNNYLFIVKEKVQLPPDNEEDEDEIINVHHLVYLHKANDNSISDSKILCITESEANIPIEDLIIQFIFAGEI